MATPQTDKHHSSPGPSGLAIAFAILFIGGLGSPAVAARAKVESNSPKQCSSLFAKVSQPQANSLVDKALGRKTGEIRKTVTKGAADPNKLEGRFLTEGEMIAAGLNVDADQELRKKINKREARLIERSIKLVEHIDWVEKVLKDKYIGWDERITQIMSQIRFLVSRPDTNEGLGGPMFIPIMTFPGYGKTTFVFDLMALLVQHPDLAYLKSRFDHIDIKENTPFLDLSPFVDAGTTEVDPKRPITKIIFWDEIQNLVSLDVLEELAQYANAAAGTPDVESKKLYVKEMIKKMNMAIDAKYPDISEFSAKRQTMLDTLWQIFGNGRAKSLGGTFREWAERIDELYESQYKVGWTKYIENKSMLEHLKVRYEKMVARKESSAFENTPLINAEISRYRQEIEQTETAIRNVELQGANSVSTNIYRAMVPQLRNFVANFPDLLKFYGVGSVEEMAQSFAKDPEESVARLNDLIEKFPTSNYRDYRRMIVIAAGNPPEFMKDLFTRGQAESGHLDADTAHRLALSSNPKITYREFRARFGATEAMQSRLRMKDWTPIPPFNTSMWLKLIERRMRQTEAEFATMTHKMTRAMPRGTMDVTLRLDDSVRDLLQQRGIDVSGGPRVTLDNCSRILRMAEVNLPQILRKLPDEHRLWASNRIEVIKELPAGDASPIPNVDSPAYQYAKMTVDGKIVLVRKWKKMGLVISYEEKTNSLLVAEDAPVPLKGRFIVIGRNSKQVFTTFEHDQIALEDLFQTRLDLGEKVQDSKLSAQAGVKQLRPIASARQ